MKVILDPNMHVSAAVASGVSAQPLDRWLTDRPFELAACPSLIAELRGVLERPKFRRWITVEDATALVDLIEREAEPNRPPVLHSYRSHRRTTAGAGSVTRHPGTWKPAL